LRRAAPASRGVPYDPWLGDGEFAEVEDRGREHSAGAAVANAFDEMIKRADTPDAMTGTDTARVTARVSARSKPLLVPSRSIDVNRISPRRAPPLPAHSQRVEPVGLRRHA